MVFDRIGALWSSVCDEISKSFQHSTFRQLDDGATKQDDKQGDHTSCWIINKVTILTYGDKEGNKPVYW